MSSNFLKEILIALSEKDIKFIIFGGVAVVLHGVERMTLDLDLSLEMSSENIKKFLEVIKKFELTPRAPLPPEVLLDKELINYIIKEKNAIAFTFLDRNNPFKQIDVLIHPDLRYELWINKVDWMDLFGYKICVLSKQAIIELKQNLKEKRDKDKMDIKELKKSLKKTNLS